MNKVNASKEQKKSKYKRMESMSNICSRVMPQPMDIILGRGKRYLKHPGNVIFKDLIWTNRQQYSASSFSGKKSIVDTVIHTIQSKGGRFIRIKDSRWSIIPSRDCRSKIAHAFQHHIRNEFSKCKSIPVSSSLRDDIMNAWVRPEVQVSHHKSIAEGLLGKLSLLHNGQQVANALTRSCNGIGNSVLLYSIKPNVHQTELLTTEKVRKSCGCESPHTTGIHHKVAHAFLLSCDSTMQDKHGCIFPPETINAVPEWRNEVDPCFPQDMPPSNLPNFGVNTGMCPFRPLTTQQKSAPGDLSSTLISPSVSVFTDMLDRGERKLSATEDFCNPISERANSYFFANMNVSDGNRQIHDLQNQYHKINSANVIDTSTDLDRPTRCDSIGESETPDDVIDDDEVSQISALDGDFDVFPIDTISSSNLDPLPMPHGDDDFTDQQAVAVLLYLPLA